MKASSKLMRTGLLVLAALSLPFSLEAQQPTTPKRVLVLYWYGREIPGNVEFESLFQAAMHTAASGIEIYSEYLENNRFPGENQSLVLRDYLRKKYADRKIDVIVANSQASLQFLLKYRDNLFTQIPIVFSTTRYPTSDQLLSAPGSTGLLYMQSHKETLELALKLHPDTERVFVISGTSDHDRQFESVARRELRAYENRVSITYLTDLTLGQLVTRAKSLPDRSIILYLWQQIATATTRVESPEILAALTHSARVPVYALTSSNVGRGVVGGYVATVERNVPVLAEMARLVANGVRPAEIPVQNAPVVPMFDWRQLQRWDISEDRLPPGSIIRFRNPTMWQQYKWQIIAAIIVFILQAFLIAGLLIERRRARRIRGELENYKGHLEELVKSRTTELVEARDEALAANKSKSMFLAHMSHELRTPLNAILGFSAIVRRDADLSDEHRKDLAIVGNSGEHLLGLIDEVLDTAKIETGSTSVESIAADVHSLMKDTVNMLRERAETKNLELLVNIASRCPQFVRTDPVKLRQVITNLIGNAIKYTEHGTISVELDAAPKAGSTEVMLLLDVQDTGIGIAPEDHARIFKPFVQVGSAAQGTGLGLSISSHFTQLLGGTIQVDSTPGHGSRFHVELPVQLAEAFEVTGATANVRQVIGLRPGQPEYRILIVEDQRENWMLLQHLLETTGFKVRVADNGFRAVEEFKAWRPHFIWMDVRLPGIDGLEATRRIRRLADGLKVKIVAVTASAFASQRAEVIAAGCDDFLRKPYRHNEIFECMARYLGVEYLLRTSSDATSAATIAEPVGLEDLASLPAALRDEIESAVVSLDRTQIAVLVGRVSLRNGPLGIVLGHLADKLAYSRILQALQSCKTSLIEHSPGDSACDQEPLSDASTTVHSESR